MKKGSIHVSMSTIGAATHQQNWQRNLRRNILYYISAPVLGRPPAAEAKLLFILVSGKAEAKEKAQTLLCSDEPARV